MSYMIYIIIAVIIVAAIAVFLMRGSKNKTPSQPTPAAAPKPLERAKSVPIPAAVPETDYILNAQDYINQQRYDDAISELKKGLKKKPNNSAIMLKLLNVFAITNRRDEFDSLFNDINTNTDPATVKQAQDLKTMLDEEANLKNPPEAVTAASPVQAEADLAPTNTNNEEMSLDFGDMEDFSTDDTAADSLSSDAPVSTESVDDTDAGLSFDDLESQLLDDGTTTAADESTLEFSPSLDLETTSDTAPTAPTTFEAEETSDSIDSNDTNDDFDLSFDDVDPVSPDTELTAETPTQELNFKDVDASIEENVLTVDELDADFEIDALETEALSTDSSDVNTAAEFDLTEDDNQEVELSWEEPHVETVTEIQPVVSEEPIVDPSITDELDSSELATDELAVDELVTDEPAVDEPVIDASNTDSTLSEEAPTATTDYDDTFSQLDALSATELLGATTETEEEKVDDVASMATTDDVVIDDSQEAVLQTEDVTAPVIDDSEFMKSFGFLQDLDNSQITLDLAQQYLELGEYDSAKRLVTEVMDSDTTDAQKTIAQEILARMN